MLAVAEDATAAQLMGIRPDGMQAIAWAIAAGATGLAGALIATFFYIAPTVGETLGIVAFVTVSLGGFGSVPGALVAGLLIGVIELVSAYWIGAALQGHRGVFAVPVFPLVPAAGLDGQDVMRRFLWPIGRAGARHPLSAGVHDAVPAAARRAGAAVRDRGLGLEHRRRLCRAGLGRPCRVLRLRRLCRRWRRIRISDCRRWSAFPPASSFSVAIAAVIGVPTLAAVRPLFQHGDDRGRRTGAPDRRPTPIISAPPSA